jgi:hypothetical protein
MSTTNYHQMNKFLEDVILAAEASGNVASPIPAIEAVRAEVATWEWVTTHERRLGGLEFLLGHRELGHLQGTIADLPFPRRRREFVKAGRTRPDQVLFNSGWIATPMRTASEIAGVVELFRQDYGWVLPRPSLSARFSWSAQEKQMNNEKNHFRRSPLPSPSKGV